MRLLEKLEVIRRENKALLAANYYNFETCKGIVMAAAKLQQPVILQLTQRSIEYMGLKTARSIGVTLSEEFGVESWIHLDHCKSIGLIGECLDAGFDSVMIDASAESFEKNVAVTREAVKLALEYKVNVEAELGSVPPPDGEVVMDSFTQPSEAKRFVDATGVNCLAVAIGSKHGFYKGEPKLDLIRLEEIRKATNAYLVLHGGSGIPVPLVQEGIRSGICKVNVATETKDTFMRKLKALLAGSDDIDLRSVFPPATIEVSGVITEKLKMVSLAG